MIKKITKTFLVPVLMLSVLVAGYSCADDDYLSEREVRRMIEEALRQNNEQLEFTQWEIINITVNDVNDWEWIPEAAHWEVVYDLPELDEFIYEQGAQIGYVFIGQQ